MHARTVIREAFVELLQGKTLVGNRVYDSRLYNMGYTSLPGIIVFSINEEVITSTISPPRSQDRIVKIIVECYAKATKEANITVDKIAAEIERLVANSIILKKLYTSNNFWISLKKPFMCQLINSILITASYSYYLYY